MKRGGRSGGMEEGRWERSGEEGGRKLRQELLGASGAREVGRRKGGGRG